MYEYFCYPCFTSRYFVISAIWWHSAKPRHQEIEKLYVAISHTACRERSYTTLSTSSVTADNTVFFTSELKQKKIPLIKPSIKITVFLKINLLNGFKLWRRSFNIHSTRVFIVSLDFKHKTRLFLSAGKNKQLLRGL